MLLSSSKLRASCAREGAASELFTCVRPLITRVRPLLTRFCCRSHAPPPPPPPLPVSPSPRLAPQRARPRRLRLRRLQDNRSPPRRQPQRHICLSASASPQSRHPPTLASPTSLSTAQSYQIHPSPTSPTASTTRTSTQSACYSTLNPSSRPSTNTRAVPAPHPLAPTMKLRAKQPQTSSRLSPPSPSPLHRPYLRLRRRSQLAQCSRWSPSLPPPPLPPPPHPRRQTRRRSLSPRSQRPRSPSHITPEYRLHAGEVGFPTDRRGVQEVQLSTVCGRADICRSGGECREGDRGGEGGAGAGGVRL